MMALPLLLLLGLGVWFLTTRRSVSGPTWLWVVAAGLLVWGFSGFHMFGRGGMMGGRMGGMMGGHMGGMMGGRMGDMMGGRGGMMQMMPGTGTGTMTWQGWVGIGLHVLLIIAAIVVGYFAWKRAKSAEPEEIRILRMRLAKGEITADEFEQVRQKLQA